MASDIEMQLLLNKYEVKNAFAFVIINEKFENPSKEREGALNDLDNINKVSEYFGFHSRIQLDLTKKKMDEEFDLLGTREFNNNDAFICFISSHGDAELLEKYINHGKESGDGKYARKGYKVQKKFDIVYGTDDGAVSLNRFVDLLANNSTLKGKPKIVITQHCRGQEQNIPSQPGENSTSPISIPSHRDVVLAYSTVFNAPAYRDSDYGSWFIHYFTKVLLHHGENMSLTDILTVVNNKIAGIKPAKEVSIKQMSCFSHSLTKPVFFKKSTKQNPIPTPEFTRPYMETAEIGSVSNTDDQKNEKPDGVSKTEKGRTEDVSQIKNDELNDNLKTENKITEDVSQIKNEELNDNLKAENRITEDVLVKNPKTEVEDKKDVSKTEVEDNKDVSKTEMEDNKDVPKTEEEDNKDVLKTVVEDKKDVPKTEMENKDVSKTEVENNKDVPKTEMEDNKDVPKTVMEVKKDVPKTEVGDNKDVPKTEVEDKDVPKTEKEDNKDVSKTEVGDNKDVPKTEVGGNKDFPKTEVEDKKDVSKTEIEDKDVLKIEVEDKDVPKTEMEDKKDVSKTEVENKDVSNTEVEDNEDVPKTEVENKDVPKTEVEDNKDVPKTEVEDNKDVPKTEVGENKDVPKTEVEDKNVPKTEVKNKDVSKTEMEGNNIYED